MKVISVPTTSDAVSRLDTDTCIDGDLKEVELTQIEFDGLWQSGFFDDLNIDLNLMIDDFEDEEIVYSKIGKAIAILDCHLQKTNQDSCLLRIKTLFELAKNNKTGIYFFF